MRAVLRELLGYALEALPLALLATGLLLLSVGSTWMH